MNEEQTALLVNPETGRDLKGRFVAGNSHGKAKRGVREITAQIRAIAAEDKVTEASLKTLLSVVKNKDNRATVSEQINAAKFLVTQFSVSAEKDADKEIAESTTASLSEMINVIKGNK